jgi:hypothetical protein
MPIRIIIAWIAGWVIYMLAMILTTYDGMLSFVCQPFMGALLTSVGILVVFVAGIPLMFSNLWKTWTKMWWISILLIFISIISMIISWHPDYRVLVLNPNSRQPIESPHLALGLGGWFAMMFGLAWCPLISFRNIGGFMGTLFSKKK